ncbi:MAG: histidine--tRNA ligase, partial [Flavobacteriales bacterium CG_4_9_14_3_um_filter_32_8]
TFPFRRFQIQPVWRADRPQKGRYREFYQCDADIIGSDSLLNEVDLIKIIDDVFTELFQGKLKYTISINNRKILQGIVESVGETDKFEQIVVAIDKFDKISYEGVSNELINCDIPKLSVEQILDVVFSVDWRREISKEIKEADAHGCLQQLANLPESIGNTINGRTGIEELEFVFEKLKELGIKTANIKFDATLARGLGYYTGTIIEVKVDNFPSICGGGRYDDLTGKFGLKDVSGVGISFGADRIYDVLLDNKLYPEFKGDSTQVLFTNQSAADEEKFLPMLFELRDKGINAELYTEQAKWQKQLIFAEKKRIKFIVSTNENGDLFVKEMDGTEKKPFSSIDELITIIRK